MEEQMGGAQMLAEDAVQDGRILTGRAAGAAFPFGLALLEVLKGREVADKVAAEVVYDRR
jgi:4-methyl-5(b-hydroxyethyl)-thiazole monophosphate biosynthesis